MPNTAEPLDLNPTPEEIFDLQAMIMADERAILHLHATISSNDHKMQVMLNRIGHLMARQQKNIAALEAAGKFLPKVGG